MPTMEDQRQATRDFARRDYAAGYDRYEAGPDRRDLGPRHDARVTGMIATGSGVKSIGGLVVAALAILSLIGLIPRILMPIAGIVFGVAMLFEGLMVSGEYNRLAGWLVDTTSERVELAGGSGVEVLVGLAAIALGILALVGLSPETLISALIIAGGAGLMMSAGTLHRLNDLQLMTNRASDFGRRLRHESMTSAAIAQMLGGIAALVLGILSLLAVGATYGTLAEVGMIVLGVAAAIGGGALAGKATMLYRHA